MDDRPPSPGDATADAEPPATTVADPSDGLAVAPAARERHPDDLPPDTTGFRVPQGLLWAMALAVVVLVIASWVALGSSGGSTTNTATGSDDLVRIGPAAPTLKGGAAGEALLGQPAPAISWKSFDGGTGSSTDLAGAPIVLNFWRSDCAPCVTEMPALEKVRQSLGDKVAFLGLATTENDEAAARRLAERTGAQYALGFDQKGEAASAFGLIGLPTTVLIDRAGTVVYVHLGEIKEDELRKQIEEKLLAP